MQTTGCGNIAAATSGKGKLLFFLWQIKISPLVLFHHPFSLLKSARIVLFPFVVRIAGKIFLGLKCEYRKLRISVTCPGTAKYFDLLGWVSTVALFSRAGECKFYARK